MLLSMFRVQGLGKGGVKVHVEPEVSGLGRQPIPSKATTDRGSM